VSAATKLLVYHSYGLLIHKLGQYEVDHLIPLELGGSNAIANLWPEPAPGYHAKDRVETVLHHRVCDARGGLIKAQEAIAADWTTALD